MLDLPVPKLGSVQNVLGIAKVRKSREKCFFHPLKLD